MAHALVSIDVIGPVLELVSIVLHSSVQELLPLLGIKCLYQLFTLLLRDEIIEDIEAWYCPSACSLGIREVYD